MVKLMNEVQVMHVPSKSVVAVMMPVQTGGERLAGNDSNFLVWLGPGLITGAADDDPSGIATYSQVGAQFGLGML
jgi:hypothetical protein